MAKSRDERVIKNEKSVKLIRDFRGSQNLIVKYLATAQNPYREHADIDIYDDDRGFEYWVDPSLGRLVQAGPRAGISSAPDVKGESVPLPEIRERAVALVTAQVPDFSARRSDFHPFEDNRRACCSSSDGNCRASTKRSSTCRRSSRSEYTLTERSGASPTPSKDNHPITDRPMSEETIIGAKPASAKTQPFTFSGGPGAWEPVSLENVDAVAVIARQGERDVQVTMAGHKGHVIGAIVQTLHHIVMSLPPDARVRVATSLCKAASGIFADAVKPE